MWLGELLAADTPAGPSDSLIVTIGSVIVAALGGLFLLAVEIVKGRNARNNTPPAATTAPAPTEEKLVERVAVLWNWRHEVQKADDIHDRTLYETAEDTRDIVLFLNRQFPGWRP